MMRLVLPLLAVTGCAANLADSFEPDASVDTKLGAAHGVESEQVEYEMKLGGLTVGRFQIAVGKRGMIEGRDSVIVRSRATLAGAGTLLGNVDWELTTTVDIESGFAIAQSEEITVDAAWREGHNKSSQTWTIGERHHNAHSAAGALRGWFTGPGAQDAVEVVLLDQRIPVTIADAAREMVDDKPTIRYDGMVHGKRPFSVWLSDDIARVPLRMRLASKVGEVEVSLVDYTVPRDP